jgi:hypothetical protein
MVRRRKLWFIFLIVLYPFLCFYFWSSKEEIGTVYDTPSSTRRIQRRTISPVLRKKAYFHIVRDSGGPGKTYIRVYIYSLENIFFKNKDFFKSISSKLMIKLWMCQNERLQLNNHYKICRMITNTLDMIKITK